MTSEKHDWWAERGESRRQEKLIGPFPAGQHRKHLRDEDFRKGRGKPSEEACHTLDFIKKELGGRVEGQGRRKRVLGRGKRNNEILARQPDRIEAEQSQNSNGLTRRRKKERATIRTQRRAIKFYEERQKELRSIKKKHQNNYDAGGSAPLGQSRGKKGVIVNSS